MNRLDFLKTFGFGIATATVAPKILFTDNKAKRGQKVDFQAPSKYIKQFDSGQIFIYESTTGDLEQGRNIDGALYPINPDYPSVPIELINIGNFKPQLLYSGVSEL